MMQARRRPRESASVRHRPCKRARIKAVRYGLFTPEEVKRLSAVRVTEAIINKSGIAHRGGVNDTKMGTITRSMLCSTCFCDMTHCQGHTGHIELAEPVLNIEFQAVIFKVLYSVCFYCSRLLLPRDHPKFASIMAIKNKKDRLTAIYDIQKSRKKYFQYCVSKAEYESLKRDRRELRSRVHALQGYRKEIASRLRNAPPSRQKRKRRLTYKQLEAQFLKSRKSKSKIVVVPPHDLAELRERMGEELREKIPLLELQEFVPSTYGCGGRQPEYTKAKGDVFIRAVFRLSSRSRDAMIANPALIPEFTPKKMKQILTHISDEDVLALGMDPQHAHPRSMLFTNLMVPPVPMRPARSSKIGGEDHLTLRLRRVVQANRYLRKVRAAIASASEGDDLKGIDEPIRFTTYSVKKLGDFDTPEELIAGERRPPLTFAVMKKRKKSLLAGYCDLQRLVAGYQDNRHQCKGSDGAEYGKEKKSIRQRFTATQTKEGRLRKTVFAKRQNMSARTVITPCSELDADQVGVPRWMCMILTFPETVNRWNIHALTRAVRNGPDRYPGANYVVERDGRAVCLKFVDRHRVALRIGDTVQRHLRNDDRVIFNRQPSLHRMSMMSHRVVVMDGSTFRLNLPAVPPYNADFDGDEMNLFPMQSHETRAEALCVMSVRKNMVKDGNPLVSFQQHAIVGAFLLTRPGFRMDTAFAQQLAMSHGHLDFARFSELVQRDRKEIMGSEFVSGFLPKGLFVNYKDVEVVDGVLVRGRLTKKTLNRGVLYAVWKDFGADFACEFVSGLQRVLEQFVYARGLTFSLEDCDFRFPAHIRSVMERALELGDEMDAMGAEEDDICSVFDTARDVAGDYVLSTMRERDDRGISNGLYEMVLSGAKGSEANIVQICAMLGQQRNHKSERLPAPAGRGDCRAITKGAVMQSFLDGPRPYEYFSHLTDSRGGLVDTAVKTADVGYSQRRIGTAVEDLVVRYDGSVRNVRGDVVQILYGDDGFDSNLVENNLLRRMGVSEIELKNWHRVDPRPEELTEMAWRRWTARDKKRDMEFFARASKSRRRIALAMQGSAFHSQCFFPIHLDRLLRRAASRTAAKEERDLEPDETREVIDRFVALAKRDRLIPVDNPRIDYLIADWCSPAELWRERRLDRHALRWFVSELHRFLLKGRVCPHESVGAIAAQNTSEPLMQLTLNSFHRSGMLKLGLISGVPRMVEILDATENPKTPFMRFSCKPGADPAEVAVALPERRADEFITDWCMQLPSEAALQRSSAFWRCWKCNTQGGGSDAKRQDIMRIVIALDREKLAEANLTPRRFCNALRYTELRKTLKRNSKASDHLTFDAVFSYARAIDKEWWVCLAMRKDNPIWVDRLNKIVSKHQTVRPSDELVAMNIFEKLTEGACVVRGVPSVTSCHIDTELVSDRATHGGVREIKVTKLVATGANIVGIALHPEIEASSITCNSIRHIEKVLGIDAARRTIEAEWTSVMTMNEADACLRHVRLVSRWMCYRGIVCKIKYKGICRGDTAIIKRASFEKPIQTTVIGATEGHRDVVGSFASSVCWNGTLQAGTGCAHSVDEDYHVPDEERARQDAEYAVREVVYDPPTAEELERSVKPIVKHVHRWDKAKSRRTSTKREAHFTPRAPSILTHAAASSSGTTCEAKKKADTTTPHFAKSDAAGFQPSSPCHSQPPVEKKGLIGFHPWTPPRDRTQSTL